MRTTSALFSLFLPPLVSDSRQIDAGLPEEHRYAVFSGSRLPEMPYSLLLGSTVDTGRSDRCSWFRLCRKLSSYASVFIVLLGSQWIHVLRQLRKRFDVISTAPCI